MAPAARRIIRFLRHLIHLVCNIGRRIIWLLLLWSSGFGLVFGFADVLHVLFCFFSDRRGSTSFGFVTKLVSFFVSWFPWICLGH
ncbi:hypothetical protein BRADI_3g50695v3 [Brachypodium distachyon]|uniref:Uncharacterized protein n=1 Tax=Brachypodium distachyon TaxID=15368 RepID=A0A2K2D4G2_BRADI|nr:hypothetical protein BRADI_3g50695v3 [Brachypodium distachyon]